MISIRASSLGRLCGVYGALSESIPAIASEAGPMLRGTRIHTEIEAAIMARSNDPLPDVIRSLGYSAAADAMIARLVAYGMSPSITGTRAEVPLATVVGGAVLHGTVDAVTGGKTGADVVVVDWKTGHCGHLRPIGEDMQMRAYAHLVGPSGDSGVCVGVYVMRVQLDTGIVDALDVRSEDLWIQNRTVVESAVAWHVEHHREPARDRATCVSCPISTHCRHYCAGVAKALPDLATITEHDGLPTIATAEDARRVAMVLRPARGVLDRLERELRAWVEDNGAVEDTGRARIWGHSLRMRDVITDHPALLSELADETDSGRAWSAAATTKQGVLRALIDGGLTRQEALGWWDVRREMGMVAKKATDVWGWSDE